MKHILLTNDDGIQSPGLWAAAEALATLGFVHVVAPREQWSGAGRSMPATSDGAITTQEMVVHGKTWTVYAVGGTPAQAVMHALFEILPQTPDLVVSGINYGENPGEGITASGTVGAALQAASHGIPAIAISLETDPVHHFSYSREIDFSTAGHFTRLFGQVLLEQSMPPDVSVLKIEVPRSATPQTPWKMTRLSRQAYFLSIKPERSRLDQPTGFAYTRREDFSQEPADSDAYVLRVEEEVSVTPLSIDLTARVDLKKLEQSMRKP